MALETSTATISSNVPGIQQPKERNTIVVNRQGSGASNPFAPQTNVLLKNAIANMQGILSNAAELQEAGVNRLPEQIQKMVQNILEKSFSLENTIAEGISSTVESQRFSADNLASLARILNQLGVIAEKGNSLEISEKLQVLLSNIKAYVTANDDSLEPVMLHKLSFQLIDGKNLEEVSNLLQSVLLADEAGGTLPDNIEQSSNLLKQLLKAFMPPKINTWSGDKQNPAKEQDLPEAATRDSNNIILSTMTETAASQTSNNKLPANHHNNPQGSAGKEAASEFNSTTQNMPAKASPEAVFNKDVASDHTGENNYNTLETVPEKQNSSTQTNNTLESQAKTKEASTDILQAKNGNAVTNKQENNNTTNTSLDQNRQYLAEKEPYQPHRNNGELYRFKSAMPDEKSSNFQKSFAPSGELKNTAETMTTMKSLADLLIKDAKLSPKDTQLLQNFVNEKNTNLSEKEAKQLQLLLKLCENNIPASVKQAANQTELRDLPKLWAFMELCDLAGLKEKKAYRLKKAARTVSIFANSMKSSLNAGEGVNTEKGKSLSFTMPLYMGEGEKTKYPAYIHIYHDTTDENEAGMTKQVKDTWLRICCLTENIGAVELTCHLFDENRVDVTLNFSQETASEDFKTYLPDFKNFMQDTSLNLNSIKVKS